MSMWRGHDQGPLQKNKQFVVVAVNNMRCHAFCFSFLLIPYFIKKEHGSRAKLHAKKTRKNQKMQKWSLRQELNLRPRDYESRALTF